MVIVKPAANITQSQNTKDPFIVTKKYPFGNSEKGDESAVSDVICTTIAVSNSKDYSPEFIEENIKSHSPQVIASRAAESHFYVALDGRKIIRCGGITGYWGSDTESYLVSIFVLPEYQGRGIGRRIIETLEADEYFLRAWRTEVGSSLTAVDFYLRMGYKYKNGITAPDEFGVVRLEKINEGQLRYDIFFQYRSPPNGNLCIEIHIINNKTLYTVQ